jgi:AmmeMemoRadiSam system protein A
MIILHTSGRGADRRMTAEFPLIILQTLTLTERRDLLWLARRSIRANLHGEEEPTVTLTPALRTPTAAFVSLHRAGRLRGCIGTLDAERPLHETVAQMAQSAAFDDPRFPPLTTDELSAIDIEISRLSALVPARPEDVCPGRHGVCVSFEQQRAVFLPQVATTHNWDRETLLRELCCKALLPPDAWKQPATRLMVFEAEVFGEAAEGQAG